MLRLEERGGGVERDVPREREPDREPPRREVRPPLDGLEPEPEDRAVRRVQHEPGRLPASPAGDELPEQRDVPVVRAEEPLVERLEQPPDRRRSRPGGRRADTARYLHSLSLGADGATLGGVPEGDSLHRAARRLRVLVGERLEVEAPHPRGHWGQPPRRGGRDPPRLRVPGLSGLPARRRRLSGPVVPRVPLRAPRLY